MFDIFFAMIAAGLSAAPADQSNTQDQIATLPPAVTAPTTETTEIAPAAPAPSAPAPQAQAPAVAAVPQTAAPAPSAPATPAQPTFDMSVVPQGLVPDPQVPTGKFTTAAEVKPILTATKANWVVVRPYEGKDWLYITHLWSWRCGLKAIAISLNDEPMQNWPMPGCYENTVTPNAILPDDGLPALTLRLNSVQRIKIQIVYDDLSMDRASFERGNVLIP